MGEHSKSQTCTELGPIGCQVEIIRVFVGVYFERETLQSESGRCTPQKHQ